MFGKKWINATKGIDLEKKSRYLQHDTHKYSLQN
jgi:hypothetical protein